LRRRERLERTVSLGFLQLSATELWAARWMMASGATSRTVAFNQDGSRMSPAWRDIAFTRDSRADIKSQEGRDRLIP
jgi:hypothetical protein